MYTYIILLLHFYFSISFLIASLTLSLYSSHSLVFLDSNFYNLIFLFCCCISLSLLFCNAFRKLELKAARLCLALLKCGFCAIVEFDCVLSMLQCNKTNERKIWKESELSFTVITSMIAVIWTNAYYCNSLSCYILFYSAF